jgi:hypothetical protein
LSTEHCSFLGLARNTPSLRRKADAYKEGTISLEEYLLVNTMTRNEISQISNVYEAFGAVITLAVSIAVLKGIHADASNNNRALFMLNAICAAVFLVLAIQWSVSAGTSLLTVGFSNVYRAGSHILRLKQTLTYFAGMSNTKASLVPYLTNSGFFLLGDSINTIF